MDSKGALTIFDTPGKNCPLNILTPHIYIVNTTLEIVNQYITNFSIEKNSQFLAVFSIFYCYVA